MGCCEKKGDEEVNKCGMIKSSERKCRDTLCCLLFVVYWVGMLIVAMVSMSQGNPHKLIYGKDFNESVCGQKHLSNETLLYYPRLNDDLLYAAKNNIPFNEMKFYGICVHTCPKESEVRCGYGNENCWTASMDTDVVFFRCLPLEGQNKTVLETKCVDPKDADPTCDITRFISGKCDKICKVKREKALVFETKESSPNPLLEQMQGFAQMIGRLTGDIENAGSLVLAVGGAGALFLGVVWLVVLQFFASTMVWLTCFLVIISMFMLSLYCSVKAEIIDPKKVPGLSKLANQNHTAQVEAATGTEKQQFVVLSYFTWGVTAILFVLILAMKKRIKIAIGIIREASKCIQRMPLLVIWPAVPAVLTLLLVVYWMAIAAYVASAESISAEDIKNSVESSTGQNFTASFANSSSGNSTAGLGKLQGTSTKDMLFFYHLFGLLWTNQLIQAISICTIGGAVAEYYWTLPDQFGKRKLRKLPIFSSLHRSLRFHLGSLCFGALIIALVQMARIVLEYVDRNSKGLQEKNGAIKVLMKVVKCCLWCFEKCVKFLSKNAYIMIAMKGGSFCTSARQAFSLIVSNVARVSIVNGVSFFLLLLAKITITAGTCAAVFSATSTNDEYMAGGKSEISSPFAPVLVTALLAWFVSSSFMNVYDMAIDTILVCFCEDTKLNNEGSSDYMSSELQNIMGGAPAKSSKQVDVSPRKPNLI